MLHINVPSFVFLLDLPVSRALSMSTVVVEEAPASRRFGGFVNDLVDVGPFESASAGDAMPQYTQPLASPSHRPQAPPSSRSTEHVFSLDEPHGLSLTLLNSWASSSKALPRFRQGRDIEGRITLSLKNPEGIQKVTITVCTPILSSLLSDLIRYCYVSED